MGIFRDFELKYKDLVSIWVALSYGRGAWIQYIMRMFISIVILDFSAVMK